MFDQVLFTCQTSIFNIDTDIYSPEQGSVRLVRGTISILVEANLVITFSKKRWQQDVLRLIEMLYSLQHCFTCE